ncbi:MAG: dethiobiotin synthase [Gammaproteobacteria bacterium]|nr:dethiobiotin synthase [Gammaproteobacteria bacterium]
MTRGLFITGTDTGVGKTRVGTLLIRELVGRDLRICVRKPVESGCMRHGNALVPADALALRAAAGNREALDRVCAFPLEAPVSPTRAAALAGQTLDLEQLIAACRQDVGAEDFLVVEGAGGFLSPLTRDELNADLARQLDLPVLLVTADRLGAVHQVLVAAEAIARRGLILAAVVLNQIDPALDARLDNAAELAHWLGRTIIALPSQAGTGALPQLAALAEKLARNR